MAKERLLYEQNTYMFELFHNWHEKPKAVTRQHKKADILWPSAPDKQTFKQ